MVATTADIQAHMNVLSKKIAELEELKAKAEKIDLAHSRECCPDVCKVIDESIGKLNIELQNAEKEKIKIHKLIKVAARVFHTEESDQKTLERQALRKTERIEILIKEQMTSLNSLKQTLSTEKVCDCD